jgi:hypothetical protein
VSSAEPDSSPRYGLVFRVPPDGNLSHLASELTALSDLVHEKFTDSSLFFTDFFQELPILGKTRRFFGNSLFFSLLSIGVFETGFHEGF